MKLLLGSLFILMVIEIYLAPYTKVEESFNLQATHDIIHQVEHYDHLDFPGVVPRTFLGACILSALSWPLIYLFPSISLLNQQILVRIVLAALVIISLGKFTSGVKALFGSRTAIWTLLLLHCQFHFVFWSSRTLPNTLALPWTLFGLSHWISSLSQMSGREDHLRWMIRYLTFTGIVFRFEVGILLVILLGIERFLYRTIDLYTILKETMTTAFISLLVTIPLDSFFWNTWWLWPEGMVFYFNAILNKSSEWGTLPFYAYFTSFLPRLLLVSYPLAWIAFATDRRSRRLLLPMIIYIVLFSCLPHKEWRFIMYTIPVFTAAAASCVSTVITTTRRSTTRIVVSFSIIIAAVIASFMIAIMMFQISRLNYPGGQALASLHSIENHTSSYVHVHIDTDTAMTGASLYGQSNPNWIYSKNESHETEDDFLEARYTHLITAHPDNLNTSLFEVIDISYGLDNVRLKHMNEYMKSILKNYDFMPIEFNMSPKLYTLRLIQPQRAWIQYTLRKYPFVLYSKTYCPYSIAAKQLLSKYCKDIHIVEANLDQDSKGIKYALFELTGQRTFPNFFKNGQSLGGYDQLSVLDREGKLSTICNV
ncbi:Alg9-like mannosyltransferase family-domain-containing protein [Cokeromyces recurvatus]|uniref:Alg9-like mannosyltransferase family-domain-containing protein n=1 Tax=Cokeromyces recurvatus TaxID=90255 RepID=UPI00221EAABF|nr:Alg9-like mannosyltransferase family-domain-containing protein [Cokeromyces recurvatus]KAI7902184.1 Alg9-like mannosyltransferase family-domain-containing protein [Cokeromyces recurvatus]